MSGTPAALPTPNPSELGLDASNLYDVSSHNNYYSKYGYPTPSPNGSISSQSSHQHQHQLSSDDVVHNRIHDPRYPHSILSSTNSSTYSIPTNPLASYMPTDNKQQQPSTSSSIYSPSSSSAPGFSNLPDQYWSRASNVAPRNSTNLDKFSLSNTRNGGYQLPAPYSSLESKGLTGYGHHYNHQQHSTTAFSVAAPPLQIPTPQVNNMNNTLYGNPFGFFFNEYHVCSENAVDSFQSISHHHQLNLKTFPSQPPVTLSPHCYSVNPETAYRINQYLSFPGQIFKFSAQELSQFIKEAWLNHEYVNFILHRPLFIANRCDTSLLATLAFLGIYCVHTQHAHLIPMYNELKGKHIATLRETQHVDFKSKLTIIQSCSLLIWRNFVRSSSAVGSHTISDPNHMSIEALISMAGAYLKLGGGFTPQQNTRIYYSNASVDSYQFIFQETSDRHIMDQQWQTWVDHESCIRVLHFLMFISKERLAITKKGNICRFVDFDVPMSSPDSLWKASSTEMFFHTVGPARVVRTLSYIHLLKCMLRIPSLTDIGNKSSKNSTSDRTTWTLGPYVIVLYGLATVAWGVGGGSPELFDAVHKSFDKDYNPATSSFRRAVDAKGDFVSDRSLQSRIFHAFEMLEVLCERTTKKFDEADFIPYMSSLNGNSSPGNTGRNYGNVRNVLSHLAHEPGSPSPWLCTIAGSLHFQLCYFSLYREVSFAQDLMAKLPSRLPQYSEVYKTQGREEAERYLLFGKGEEFAENHRQFYSWIHHDRTQNWLAISAYYLINLVAAKNSVVFGGLEASVMRELLNNAVVYLWIWDYYNREKTGRPPKLADIPPYLMDFWTNSSILVRIPKEERYLIERSLGYLLVTWQHARKSFMDHHEKYERNSREASLSPENSAPSTPEYLASMSTHSLLVGSHCGVGPCMQIFVHMDSALRLDSTEPLNEGLCTLAKYANYA